MKLLVALVLVLAACTQPQQTADSPATTQPDAQSPSPAPGQPPAGATIVEEPVQSSPSPSPSPAPQPSQPSAPAPSTPSRQGNVTIETVQVANPLTVSGQARTFENNVALRARAADGSLISEGFATATGEMGQFSPYRGTLWLTRDPGSRIIVEALEYSAKDGSEQSLVRAERPFSAERVESRLYFPDQACTGVKPYTRRLPKTMSMARLLVEALMAGPTRDEQARGANNPFPRGAHVQSVNLRDGTLTVDFNERLRNVGGSCAAQMIRASVTESLRQLPAVKKVVITAAGSESLALQP